MERYIVTIGGGEIKDRETLEIDKYIVSLCENETKRLLFIPTASWDAERYIETIKDVYGNELKCEVDTLLLADNPPSREVIKQKIKTADIIYVGGGSTRFLLKTWKSLGVDKLIIEAYQNGTILSGLSAGSICWYEFGHSDSNRIETNGESTDFIKVKGLGLLEGIHCPHYNLPERTEDFPKMMKNECLKGIALDENCALVYKNETIYKVLSTKEDAKAYLFNKTIKTEIAITN